VRPLKPVLLASGLVVAALAAGCGGDGETAPGADTGSPASVSTASGEESAGGGVEGRFDVGGHTLYLKCRGTEEPTVVYLHGSITDASAKPHFAGEFLFDDPDHRACVYDRRNLGDSETVDAPQRPADAIADLHGLLAAAGVEPPYVLLGASFGGALAYLYANAYPDDVAGMVLLDSMFVDELSLEHLLPPEVRYATSSADEERVGLERISHFKVLKASERYVGKEPAIPVTYLSSIPEGYDVNDFGVPEYDRQILGLQEAYVGRFSPGKYLRVDSPHFMEQAIPETILQELDEVIAAAGY
jgi:pimeloyl-ACP methyl ester carboxylesterase